MQTHFRAEVISIGDEMTSGQRLDTNSQWLSQQLGDLGIEVAFHTTVGDDLQDNIDAFRIATERADFVVCTGGLGPTADDLTRQAIADMVGVELVFHEHVVRHIEKIFNRHSREMPESNRIQAYFPTGAEIVDNPEGTAPGIDLIVNRDGSSSRIFALPGVPYEMKQMWNETVLPAITKQTGQSGIIHHHVIHCFGTGESQTEEMLPDLIRRGRDPRVGITASLATISLRVTTRAESIEACQQKMEPTLSQIREVMGSYVFGENNVELQEVVFDQLELKTISILDLFLNGEVAGKLLKEQERRGLQKVLGSLVLAPDHLSNWLLEQSFTSKEHSHDLSTAAITIQQRWNTDVGLAIGPLKPANDQATVGGYQVAIADHQGVGVYDLSYGGHSKLRHTRSVKQVLNQLRLHLG